jgi:aminoglycoside phosphotransferase (APT) family kinase protein
MSNEFIGTRPVSEKHAFDLTRLAAWLRTNVAGFEGGEDLKVAQFKGGQSNPTFLLQAGERKLVLRRKPPGTLLPSAHAVDREFRVISALAGTDVPVARAHALCTDDSVIGTMFYVMDCVEGRILWDAALPGMAPAERGAMYDEMNRVVAALHTVDPAAVGLADYGKPGGYFERQTARWAQQYRAAETDRIEAMDSLIDWLPKHIPAGDDTAIVHGDFRIDNLVFHPTEPKVLAVLDWELSTLGHPMADFAYHCLAWNMPPGKTRGLLGLDLAALGIPSQADYVARYCERTARAPVTSGEWNYYLAFNLFRLAAIAQGIAARALQGNAASAQAVEMGKMARPVADAAWQLIARK